MLTEQEQELLNDVKGCCEGRSGPDGHRIKALIQLLKDHPELITTVISFIK
jgi:hypothetical protein